MSIQDELDQGSEKIRSLEKEMRESGFTPKQTELIRLYVQTAAEMTIAAWQRGREITHKSDG